jgi:OOP family OmpA-OmpF porin
MRTTLLACALLIAGVAHAQDNPAAPAVDTSAAPVAAEAEGPPAASLPTAGSDSSGVMAPAAPAPLAPPSPYDQANYEHQDSQYYGEHEYFSTLGSYVIPDGDRGTTRHGGGFSFIYGHLFNQHLSVEVDPTVSVFNTGKNKGTDFYQYGGTIDLSYAFLSRTQNAWSPFLLAGVGGTYEDVQPTSAKKGAAMADAGIGVISEPLFYGAKFRAEGRYIYDFTHELSGRGEHDYRISAGIEIPLGRVVRTVTPAPRPVEMVQLVARPWVDSDGDGVDDEHDKCPNTPKGFKVDSDGCIIPGQTIILRGITFEFNKDRLSPNARAVIDGVVPAFTGQPSLQVEIGGHTDSVGSVSYNQGLSQRRAEAVRQYLISQGAKPEQIVAKGYGKSQLLINPEKTSDDRELNRRVEFKVVGK